MNVDSEPQNCEFCDEQSDSALTVSRDGSRDGDAGAHVVRGRGLAAVSRPDAQRRLQRPGDRRCLAGQRAARQVWKKDVGPGFSGPVVADGKVILFHRVGDQEVVEALQPATGATIWQYGYPTTYRDDFGFDEGPRAVPVVASGVVYTFGAEGQLHAVDLASGKKLWSEDTAASFGVAKNFFGAGGSPLVEDGRVIANIGGKDAGIVAFEARTGRCCGRRRATAPVIRRRVGATIGGERVAIFFTRNGIVVLDPATGTVKVQQAWRSRSASSVNAASPLVVGDLLFISAEYGPGAGVFRIGDGALDQGVGVGRGALDPLRDRRAARRHSLRLSRAPGIRSEPARRRAADRQGAVDRRSVPRRQHHAGRRSTGDRPRIGRAGHGAGDAGRVQAERAGADHARHRARVSGAVRRLSVRQERPRARCASTCGARDDCRLEASCRDAADAWRCRGLDAAQAPPATCSIARWPISRRAASRSRSRASIAW